MRQLSDMAQSGRDDVRRSPAIWPDKPMLRAYRDGALAQHHLGRVRPHGGLLRARHLRAAGVAAGDRVVIAAENRPEYPIAETALMAIRAVPVPAYTTNTVEDHAHILRDSGARAASRPPRRWPPGCARPGDRPAAWTCWSGAPSMARRTTCRRLPSPAPLVGAGRRYRAAGRHRTWRRPPSRRRHWPA